MVIGFVFLVDLLGLFFSVCSFQFYHFLVEYLYNDISWHMYALARCESILLLRLLFEHQPFPWHLAYSASLAAY